MSNRIKTYEKVLAHGISTLSGVCASNRAIGRFVIGEEPRRWRVSKTPTAEVTNWIDTPGYHESGRRPATYRKVIQMETDAVALQEQAERDWPDAVPAVAFTVGSALLTADLSIKEINEMREFAAAGSEPARADRVAVAMGVGQYLLRSTIGVRSLSANTFTQAEMPVTVTDMLYLDHGQRDDAVLVERQFPQAHLF
jgi:hypothetical protein